MEVREQLGKMGRSFERVPEHSAAQTKANERATVCRGISLSRVEPPRGGPEIKRNGIGTGWERRDGCGGRARRARQNNRDLDLRPASRQVRNRLDGKSRAYRSRRRNAANRNGNDMWEGVC